MNNMVTYSIITDSLDTAVELATCGAALSESDTIEETIAHSRWVEDINGFEIWYCYGADHYFFVETRNTTN